MFTCLYILCLHSFPAVHRSCLFLLYNETLFGLLSIEWLRCTKQLTSICSPDDRPENIKIAVHSCAKQLGMSGMREPTPRLASVIHVSDGSTTRTSWLVSHLRAPPQLPRPRTDLGRTACAPGGLDAGREGSLVLRGTEGSGEPLRCRSPSPKSPEVGQAEGPE